MRGIGSRTGGPPTAVVVGLDCPTGLQTARVLAGLGIRVDGVADDASHPCAQTRSCERVAECDTGSRRLLGTLRRLARGRTYSHRILVPCTDQSVLLLSRSRGELPPGHRLVLAEAELLERLLDKARFVELARELEVPIPPSRTLASREDVERAAAELPFPCAVKPHRKTAAWRRATDAKLFRAGGPAELLSLYDRCSEWAHPLVAQSWIPGADTCHHTCNAYFGAGGRPLATFTSRKLRQWPRTGGQGSLSESRPEPRVRELTVDLFGPLGYRGLAYVETKRDPRTGEHLVLEVNVGRPTGRSAAAGAAGVPLLETMYRDAAGLELPAARTQGREAVRWIHLRRDAQAAASAAIRGELGPVEWLRSLRGPRVHALFSWRDPLPFWLDLAGAAGKAAGLAVAALRPDEGEGRPALRGDPERRDHAVAGAVTVRLLDPGAADRSGLRDRLGDGEGPGSDEPDLTVRFVDDPEVPELRYVEGGRYGLSEGGLHLLESPGGRPLARIGRWRRDGGPELVCRRGRATVPLLDELIDLAALRRGYLPLHASAVVHDGHGVIVAGAAHTGKTGALLAFGAQGARFVADDRVFLRRDGRWMAGLHAPLTVRPWHLGQLPELRRRVPAGRRLLARALRATAGGAGPGGRPRRIREGLRRRLSVEMTPGEVFGSDRCSQGARPGTILLLVNGRDDEIAVHRVDREEAVGRLAALIDEEWRDLLDVLEVLHSNLPDSGWPTTEELDERLRDGLERALREMEIHVVRHPHPCSLPELYAGMRTALPPREAEVAAPLARVAPASSSERADAGRAGPAGRPAR